MSNTTKLNNSQIALWGPPTSGKTWLLEAFGRKVALMNELLSSDKRFELTLYDVYHKRFVTGDVTFEPTDEATEETNLIKYRFIRQGLRDEFPYQVSTHCHYVDILDNPGGQTMGIDADLDDDQTSGLRESIKIQQRKAKNLILVMTKSDSVDSAEYLMRLRELRTEMNKVSGQRRLAVCITKADAIGGPGLVYSDDPQALLPLVFADNHEEVVEFFDEKLGNEDGHEIAYFAVSASGYTDTGEPNIDEFTGNLLNVDEWNPVNVEKPFMWLFEHVEREVLSKAHIGQSGRYYSLFKNDIANARLDARISYEKMINWVADRMPT